MRIQSVTTGEVAIPLKKPFTTALRSVNTVNPVLVRVETDGGFTGYGEAPPTAAITGETKASIAAAINEHIGPAITGRELADFDGLMAALHGAIVHNTSAKAAVDMALYDLAAKRAGLPLYQYLGGSARQLQTDITISLADPDTMVRDSLEALAAGYGILKVKVGKGGLADADTLAAIRAACPGAVLRVDANQGWDPKQAVRIIRAMEDKNLGVELVEQPVPARDVDGLREITRAVYTPILADEAVFSLRDAVHIITTRAADLINIKLMKTGGIYEALKVAALAESYGVACMMGCMLETKLAVSAAAHLAAARHTITMADLDGPGLCQYDPYEGGPRYEGGRITLSNTPGIGITALPAF